MIDYTVDDSLLQTYLSAAINWCSDYIGVYPYGKEYQNTPEELTDNFYAIFELQERPQEVEINLGAIKLLKTEIDSFYDKGKNLLILPNEPKITNVEVNTALDQERIELFNQAVKLLAGDWYRYREDTQTLTTSSIPTGIKSILDLLILEV